MTITIVFPERKMDALADHLVALTEAIDNLDPGVVAHGFLGGHYGYGARFENEVFMMHPFCWCERESCPWCGGCDCSDESTEHFLDGKPITAREYNSQFYDYAGPSPATAYKYGTPEYKAYNKVWSAKIRERDRRFKTVDHPHCDYCTGKGVFATNGALPGYGAPNFWHKPSGFRVYWYKYIARGMKAFGKPGSLNALFDECLKSLEVT